MEHLLATWGYLALFVVTALASFGIPLGSELAIGYAGVLASGQLVSGRHHHLEIVLVIVVASIGELVGSLAGYALGRFGGRSLVERVSKYALVTRRDLDRAESWFAGRGDSVVFFGRLVPLVRSFVSIAAGIGEMALAKFAAFTLLACTIWCGTLAGVGYSLGSSWHRVVKTFNDAGYVAGALVVVIVAVLVVHRLRHVLAERAAVGGTP